MKRKTTRLQTTAVSIILSVILLLAACEKVSYNVSVENPDGGGTDTVYFQTEVQPIFTANCITCHHGSRNPDLRSGYSYSSLTSGGYVTSPAETSRLYKQLNSSGHSSLTLPAEKQIIYNWIQQGALNN